MPDGQVARLTEEDEIELLEELPVRMQQAVARGEVKLAELFELVTTGRDLELCRECFRRPVRDPRLGMCATCHRRALNQVMQERLDELEARREADALKQQVCRERRKDGSNPRLSRSAGERDDLDSTAPVDGPAEHIPAASHPWRGRHATVAPCDELRVIAG